MIPGPVNGHMPIDPGGAQRQLTEAASEAGADAGTSFADLLASMLAPGAVPLQPAGTPEEAVFERLDAAEMFNEKGLFRGAAPLPSHDSMPGDVTPAAGPAAARGMGPPTDLQPLSTPLDPGSPAPDIAATATGPADGGEGPVSGAPSGASAKSVQGALPSLRGQAVSLSGTPPQSGAAGSRSTTGGGRVSPPRTTAMVAQLLAARTGSAAAQVSAQAVEGGISVMARVDRLSREERDRLRSEIGELLARHGYANADIVLNGEAWPLPHGEEN